ncbi:MAG: gamma-glutamyltransferase family protein [Pseudomonadales bacterium]|jgi:gamma-glutamyltranspeptidase/glutathione hydrolase|nr:gamma-glutamyltransferase family protein [Pseudomonadales bacterium]MDP7357946.1 gamma-glutamyltransferase family protein [Pseudomonadales bacterium]MDP7595626.1 gamma-glutamyltransferase family protein [Pseudomonadales bacterium]HJN49630.1 gamma-glutamyltransferase family protein [Pseudomonadales bacterium]|tara:strand:+ start:4613 stop:6196 length:1584 start_codon:yes stop_codon:yes gene_type:complete
MNHQWDFPYASNRAPLFARNIVATSQPLAAQAGLQMLQRGGNAVDAALATAITLTVVEPAMNGLGSDAFAIVWDGSELHGLNASGRSPAAWTPERFASSVKMPLLGWDSVTVPGAVSGWVALSDRFGNLPFADLFAAAIGYAQTGFQVGHKTAAVWQQSKTVYAAFPAFMQTFMPNGRAPQTGELVRLPHHAGTLAKIAASKGEDFYRGELAEEIIRDCERHGGAMALDDLAEHRAQWVTTISQEYRGVTLHEIPPNGQGLLALIALGILAWRDIGQYPLDSADSIHLQIEAIRLAYADIERHLADPDYMTRSVQDLLDREYLKERSKQIRMRRASPALSKVPASPDTVYLTTADQSGMMVSFIQSNYVGFGSGVVVPDTGISLQNRGYGFTLEEGHPNQVGGGKRPYHTIIPGFVTRNDQALMSFGVMGGHMQAQGHVQMMVRIFDYGQNPQTASDAPRWHLYEDGRVGVESGFDAKVAAKLARRGHEIIYDNEARVFGGAQLISRLEDGYCGASDHRKEGQAVGY